MISLSGGSWVSYGVRRVLLYAMLVLVSLVQAGVVREAIKGEFEDARAVPAQSSATVRSAYLLFSPSVGDYIHFIREEVPDSARIVLPPHNSMFPYDQIVLMQYYFFPREVVNCGVGEVSACLDRVTGPGNYLLAVGDFPPEEQARTSKRYIAFDDERGLFAPRQ